MKNEKPIYIKDFCKALGVSHDTIRNYQKKGVLPDRRHAVNNYRIFTQEDLQKMQTILQGKVSKKG
jgi:DNA-binding transcriptional MerR regulator